MHDAAGRLESAYVYVTEGGVAVEEAAAVYVPAAAAAAAAARATEAAVALAAHCADLGRDSALGAGAAVAQASSGSKTSVHVRA